MSNEIADLSGVTERKSSNPFETLILEAQHDPVRIDRQEIENGALTVRRNTYRSSTKLTARIAMLNRRTNYSRLSLQEWHSIRSF